MQRLYIFYFFARSDSITCLNWSKGNAPGTTVLFTKKVGVD